MGKVKGEAVTAIEAPKVIFELVERFGRNREAYKAGKYNETQVRLEFINPMFKALGWDVDNEQGYAEAYKDVIHEDAIRVDDAVKAPDYCFRIGGTRKFFLEAKKPSVDIKGDPSPAFQLRRYAWSGKLPLSILTDFEEFAVYDCRVKPDKNDKSSKARITYYTFDQYTDPKVWSDIASVFSREAILKGSFDKYAQSTKRKRGTAEVDDAFLAEIESWRTELAKNIALRNRNISTRELNTAVQLTVDRIIFLRICEDRGIEDYGRLQALRNGDRVYQRLFELFAKADQRYNSGLFYFKAEKGRGEPDSLTPSLSVDDKVLKGILKSLYYPDSPYEFSVLPADILGHVYEQFLGKVIRLTGGHQAKIEEKPEVRKAGGVYYTPTYIVEYIVQHTVGKLLDGASVKWVGTEKGQAIDEPRLSRTLRVLDPACGSGSFLIGAYQYLLDWHLNHYVENEPEKWARRKKPPIAANQKGEYRLTTPERKRILLEHIYGVDIDAQAVEVTKLSLLLKVLEGETAHSLGTHLWYEKERALPDLSANIKCGNSLIGPDFYDNQQQTMFDEEERYRINAFDWKAEFPEVFAGGKDEGGFDAVIGNPPYGAAFAEPEIRHLRTVFDSPRNSLDSFILFMEQAGRLLSSSGCFGMIVPSGWTSAPSAKGIRTLFLESYRPESFVSLPFDVFKGAYIDAVIVTGVKSDHAMRGAAVDLYVFPQRHSITSVSEFDEFHKSGAVDTWLTSGHNEYLITCAAHESHLINKIRASSTSLGDLVEVKRGLEVFHPTERRPNMARPMRALSGSLRRYRYDLGEHLYVDYAADIEVSKPLRFFSEPRILIRQVLSRRYRLQAVFTNELFLTNQSVQSLLAMDACDVDLRYLLAIINSQLLAWFFRTYNSVARRDDFPKIIIAQTRNLPLPELREADTHDQLVHMVQHMLDQHKRLATAKTAHEQEVIQRDIDATDRQIDQLVYDLYGLTEEEIAIVEEATKA